MYNDSKQTGQNNAKSKAKQAKSKSEIRPHKIHSVKQSPEEQQLEKTDLPVCFSMSSILA